MYHVVLKNSQGEMKDSAEIPRLLDATIMVVAMSGRLHYGWSITIKSFEETQ